MNLELKIGRSYRNTMLTVAFVAIALVIISTLLASIFVYVASAFLAVFFVFDKSKRKIHSVLLLSLSALITVIYNVSVLLLFSDIMTYNIYGAEAALLAIILSLMFLKKRTKAETVIALCSLVTVFIIFDLYFVLVGSSGTFSLVQNKELLLSTVAELRSMFIDSITNISIESNGFAEAIFTEEAAAQIFDGVIRTLAGLLFIPVFFGAGIICKIFSYITFILIPEEDHGRVIGWHFETTNIVAYFYCVLFILNAIVTPDTTLGVAIANLTMIFTVVYAYVGINFVLAILAAKRKRTFSWLIIFIALFMLSSLAVRILSLIGVFCTIVGNKARSSGYRSSGGSNPFNNTENK